MSDTKITAEEREMWASVATARINAVTPERLCEITAQERLVKALNALEHAEARAEKAEANVARLTKERDWLAEKAIRFNPTSTTWSGPDDGLWMTAYNSKEKSIEAWIEAARRAVAAGEEICQK